MSLCDIFAMQTILYQFKNDVAERDSDPPAHAANLVANPYTRFRL